MVSYTDALKTVIENTQSLPVEEKLIAQCVGQVSAEDIYSGCSLPMTRTGGPDGYAIRANDIAGATKNNPVSLRVIGTVRAGLLPKKSINAGMAMRTMTGSVVPDGADCVVRFEDTDEPGNKNGPNLNPPATVKIYVSLKSGDNIRPAGGNVTEGALVMPKGTSIGPAQISALATIGKTRIKVYRRPVFAIIATGDELIHSRQQLSPGKAYNCNSAAIAALVTHYGGIPRILGIARDKQTSLTTKIRQGLTADAIITTGGVSMGDYDIVRLFMEKSGKLLYAKLRMGPGASFAFGMIKSPAKNYSIPFFGLSGPPIGAMNNFETLVRPALMKMLGFKAYEHPVIKAISDDDAPEKRPMDFVKWTTLYKTNGEYRVSLNSPKGTGMLGGLTTSNSLVIIPENTSIRQGDKITVMPLDWCLDYQIQEKRGGKKL